MICETFFVLDIIPKRSNLVLKQNLFSLKNLQEMYSGALLQIIVHCNELLKKHIHNCSVFLTLIDSFLSVIHLRFAHEKGGRVRFAAMHRRWMCSIFKIPHSVRNATACIMHAVCYSKDALPALMITK